MPSPKVTAAFADHRDDFSLLDKIKQVFPEIVCPNRAHPQFVASCQSAEPASVARCCIDATIGLFYHKIDFFSLNSTKTGADTQSGSNIVTHGQRLLA